MQAAQIATDSVLWATLRTVMRDRIEIDRRIPQPRLNDPRGAITARSVAAIPKQAVQRVSKLGRTEKPTNVLKVIVPATPADNIDFVV
jgi:hypothetical protein